MHKTTTSRHLLSLFCWPGHDVLFKLY